MDKNLLQEEFEQAEKRGGADYAIAYVEGLSDGYQQALQQHNISGLFLKVDWKNLRQKYFSECTAKDSMDGIRLRIDYAPHDLFEWFKREMLCAE